MDIENAIKNRDVKATTRCLHALLKKAGPDIATVHQVKLALFELSTHYRNWEEIGKHVGDAYTSAQLAEDEGRAESCISFDTQKEDVLRVRAAQAKKLIGSLPIGALKDVEEATEILESLIEFTKKIKALTEC